MTCDPAQKYCFTTLCKVGLLFYKPLDKNQFDFDATNCLMTQHGIGKDYNFFSFEANNVYGQQKSVQLSLEDACSIRQSNTFCVVSVNDSCP